MINKEDNLLVSNELFNIAINYTEEVLLRNLKTTFCFGNSTNFKELTDKAYEINKHPEGEENLDVYLTIHDFIAAYFEKLSARDRTAFYFWTIERNYFNYCSDLEEGEKIGAMLTYKLNNPDGSNLAEDCFKAILEKFLAFADDLKIHLKEESDYLIPNILELIGIQNIQYPESTKNNDQETQQNLFPTS